MTWVRRLAWIVVAVALVAAVAWFALLSPLQAVGEFDHACEAEGTCAVRRDGWFEVTVPGDPAVGVIIYPGARVEPDAYAPVAELLATEEISVFVMDMPLNLAIFDQDAADSVIEAHPDVEHWVVGGHSLGGAMAARFAGEDDRVDGLVLWAAYPEASLDLRGSNLAAASISASEDGLTTPADIADSRSRLPAATVFTEIEGGNHAQFGAYGPQRGDNEAAIPAEEQWRQVAESTRELVDSLIEAPVTNE